MTDHTDLINVECRQDPVTGDWHLTFGCTVTPKRIFVDNITETGWDCRTHVYEERPPRTDSWADQQAAQWADAPMLQLAT